MIPLPRKPAVWLSATALIAASLWAVGALWYDLPWSAPLRIGAAALLFLATVFFWVLLRGRHRWFAALAPLAVLVWWLTLRPSNNRAWLPDVVQTGWAEIGGDLVTIHNIRNFDYKTEADYSPRWETRQVRISEITGMDLAINYWGSLYMAHPIVSFQFANAPPLCFSTETRKEKDESYSAIGGLYRQYELICIAADERDVLRVRTNCRKGEDVYLYRLAISPECARIRFMDYLRTMNGLRENPRWYNAVTTNCTTSIRTQHDPSERQKWDWRILLNGKADEMLYENGALRTVGLSFAQLKKGSLINPNAQAADKSADFSRLIRAFLPAFSEVP
jgi:hypothetical protein